MKKQDKKLFYIGCDLGQSQDYTAITILERIQKFNHISFDYDEPFYHCRYLKRMKLNTSYPDIVKFVSGVYSELQKEASLQKPLLIIDSTGCGRPVYDMFMQAGLNPKGINIHGGVSVSREKGFYNVPKRDLVGVLQMLFQTGKLKVARDLPEAQTFIDELLNFKVKININTAHDSYEAWREGIHDDLVLSVACAAWFAEKVSSSVEFLK